MSNLEIALDNVDAAFREGEKAGITVEKETYRASTYEEYPKTVKTMIRELTANVLGGDVEHKRILPKYMNGKTWDHYFNVHLVGRYERGEITADSIQKRVHALEAFRTMIRETNVCGKDTEIRVGNKEERLEHLQELGVHKSKNEIKAIKPNNFEVRLYHEHFNTKTENGRISKDITEFQREVGTRIKSNFKLQVKDFDFEKGLLHIRNDKNNYSRVVPLPNRAMQIAEKYCSGKANGAQVFTMKDRNGNDMKKEAAVKTVQRYSNDAAKKAGINREKRRYNTHSNRKYYAQNLYNNTRNMTEKELEKKIGEFIRLQGSNREGIVQRMKNELNRINAYRIKMGYEKSGFTKEHLRRLYVSLHLGHSRCDVVLRYIKPDAGLVVTGQRKAS